MIPTICKCSTLDLKDGTDRGVKAAASIYAVYHRRNLLYTASGRRHHHALRLAGISKMHGTSRKKEEMVEHCKDLVKGVRNVRTEMDVPPSRKAKLFVVSDDATLQRHV